MTATRAAAASPGRPLPGARATAAHRLALTAARDAEAHGWRHGKVRPLNSLAATLQHLGRLDEAVGHYRQALATARDLRADRYAGTIWRNLGGCLSRSGDLEGAPECFTCARAIADRFHDPSGIHAIRGGLAATDGRLGRFEEADEIFQALLREDERFGGRVLPGVIRLNAGISALLVGKPDRGGRVLDDARRRNRDTGLDGPIALFVQGDLLVMSWRLSTRPTLACEHHRPAQRRRRPTATSNPGSHHANGAVPGIVPHPQ